MLSAGGFSRSRLNPPQSKHPYSLPSTVPRQGIPGTALLPSGERAANLHFIAFFPANPLDPPLTPARCQSHRQHTQNPHRRRHSQTPPVRHAA